MFRRNGAFTRVLSAIFWCKKALPRVSGAVFSRKGVGHRLSAVTFLTEGAFAGGGAARSSWRRVLRRLLAVAELLLRDL